MRSDPRSRGRLLRALELFGPQARPYNFDDYFDCWGLVQRVFDWVDDGFEMNQEALDETTVGNWQEIGRRDELVPDDLYEAVMERGDRAALDHRPPAPQIVAAPGWGVAQGPLTVFWRYPHGAVVSGCRIEVWEETWDLWGHRLERHDRDAPLTGFEVPEEALRAGGCYAVVVYARGAGGFSGSAVAPFLYRPAAGDPLLEYNPVRPRALRPDAGASVPPGVSVELAWEIALPEQNQVKAAVAVFKDAGCLAPGAEQVFACEQEGPDAAACRSAVPAAALRPGHSYYWYATPTNAGGHDAFAPAEDVFSVGERG